MQYPAARRLELLVAPVEEIQFSLTERSQDICFAQPSHLTSKCPARRAVRETAAGFCGTDTLVAAA